MDDGAVLGVGPLKLVVASVVFVGLVLAGAFAAGFVGVPSVDQVDNRFGPVDDETTTVYTDVVVDNPNPIGVGLDDATVTYTVNMNDVRMATGGGDTVAIERGNSTLEFETELDNEAIPRWWASHLRSDERTAVTVDATIETGILGNRSFDLSQEEEIETDVIGQFNSDETRAVNADDPPPGVSNPILYVNRTAANWGTVTDDESPIELAFDVYNPNLEPYTITEVGYEITMNEVDVGSGATDEPYVVPGGTTETIETRAVIDNERLDDWWATHLRNDQVTDLRIDFYAVVELPTSDEIRVPLDELAHERTIETDFFGNKGDGRETTDRTPETTTSETATPAPDGTTTTTSTSTRTSTTTASTSTRTSTPTPEDDDGIL